jgi:TM2 domain-containing membrane protein YozV
MYKIIGTDGQQYGPVNADQVRRWLAEGRVNAQTLVQAEGSPEWKPLISFPEFAPQFNIAPPVSGSSYHNPRASNKIPAGICAILLGPLGVHKFLLGYSGAGIILLLLTVLSCGILWPILHIFGLVEGIIYLTKTDDDFVRTYVDGRREWF